MKNVFENIILICFALFFIGGFFLVLTQFVGIVFFQAFLVTNAVSIFDWIYPLAGITGFLCYLYSYIDKTTQE